MAATAVSPVVLALAGVVAAPVAADGVNGNSVPNPRGNASLRVINGSGGSINVTVAVGPNPTRPSDGVFPAQTVSSLVVAVGAGAAKWIGPIPAVYNDGNGNLQLTFSSATTVTFEAIQPT